MTDGWNALAVAGIVVIAVSAVMPARPHFLHSAGDAGSAWQLR